MSSLSLYKKEEVIVYAEYKLKARTIERKFKITVSKRGYILTAKGCFNYLSDYGKSHVALKTENGKQQIIINRQNLRKAISFFFFKRTAIREDFALFSNFTSAIFGIVMDCFKGLSKLQVLKGGLFRLSLIGTRFHASGLERDKATIKLLKELNGKYVLYNYKSILESPSCLDMLEEYDLYALIDSGAFSLFKKKKKSKAVTQQVLFADDTMNDLLLEGYARFINQHKDNPRILGFFPLDSVGDPVLTKENYMKLKSLTEAKIYPVWQFTDTMDELDQLVEEEHAMIGIGGLVPFISSRKHIIREVMDKVIKRHPTVNFHGLGVADELLNEYFFSADSTAFLNARKYAAGRKVYLPCGERVEAPEVMSTMEVIKQNLMYLIGLEEVTEPQLSFYDLHLEGA